MITRGIRNNNPFNIKLCSNRWKGKIPNKENKDGVFEQFVSMRYGLRAGTHLIRNYINRYNLHRVSDIINRFAPSNENKTENYISFVNSHINSVFKYSKFKDPVVFPNTAIFFVLCQAICLYESKYEVSFVDLKSAYDMV